MLLTRCLRLRKTVLLLSGVLLFGCAASVRANPKPLTKEEQAKIDKAIDKGVAFLKRCQKRGGEWPGVVYKSHPVGYMALPAYALLEAGVSPDDPTIQRAAVHTRPMAFSLGNNQTYDLSLALLFFDRLGKPKDKKLIQTLALRLIAGQHHTGGWSYRCPILNEENERALLNSLGELSRRMKGKRETRGQALRSIERSPIQLALTVFQRPDSLRREPPESPEATAEAMTRVSLTARTDNSNTQFALLGLWTAQRHGIAVEPSFEIMVRRFEAFQAYPSGIWGYANDREMNARSRRSMTCAGLLGLAIGRGLTLQTPGSPTTSKKDVHVLKGLAALHRYIGLPSGNMSKQVTLPDLYFLWSLERVGMLYNLPTICDKDWYRWGAEGLITNQDKAGCWNQYKGGAADYGPIVNTSFALLFLKRSHPMKDLTPKLPVTGKELNEGIARLLNGEIPLNRSTITPKRSTKLQH